MSSWREIKEWFESLAGDASRTDRALAVVLGKLVEEEGARSLAEWSAESQPDDRDARILRLRRALAVANVAWDMERSQALADPVEHEFEAAVAEEMARLERGGL